MTRSSGPEGHPLNTVDRAVRVLLLAGRRAKVTSDVARVGLAADDVLVAVAVTASVVDKTERVADKLSHAKPIESNGTPSVRLTRRDADLRPEPIPEPIGEPRARIDKHACRVHSAREASDGRFILRDDGVSVLGRMRVDVLDGRGERVHREDGERRGEVLGVVSLWVGHKEERRGPGVGLGDVRERGGVTNEGDGFIEELGGEGRPKGREEGLVQDERLERIAGSGIVELSRRSSQSLNANVQKKITRAHLRVNDDTRGLGRVGRCVEVGVAESVGVAHDRDLGLVLDGSHELGSSTGHDKVNELVLGEKRRNFGPRRDGLDESRREVSRGECLLNERGKSRRRVERLAAGLKDGGVT